MKPVPSANCRNYIGQTPLHVCAILNHVEVAEVLLSGGATVNYRDEQGVTPFLAACVSGNERMCSLLLKHNALPTLCDRVGLSPLHHAVLTFSDTKMKFICDILLKFESDRALHSHTGDTLMKRWAARSEQRYVARTGYLCRHTRLFPVQRVTF